MNFSSFSGPGPWKLQVPIPLGRCMEHRYFNYMKFTYFPCYGVKSNCRWHRGLWSFSWHHAILWAWRNAKKVGRWFNGKVVHLIIVYKASDLWTNFWSKTVKFKYLAVTLSEKRCNINSNNPPPFFRHPFFRFKFFRELISNPLSWVEIGRVESKKFLENSYKWCFLGILKPKIHPVW